MIHWILVRAGLLAATAWGWSGCRWQWLLNAAMDCRAADEMHELDRLAAKTLNVERS